MPILFDDDALNMRHIWSSWKYLIRNGVLDDAMNFTRTGSAIYDGVEFEQNVPVAAGGELVTCGARTNEVESSNDISHASWSKIGTTSVPTTNAVAPDDSLTASYVTNLQDAAGDRLLTSIKSGITLANTPVTGSVWLKGVGEDIGKTITIGFKRILGDFVGVDKQVTLTGEWQPADITGFVGVANTVGVYLLLKNGTGDTAGSVLLWGVAANLTKYSIHPFTIPTTDGPVTMATSAASDIEGNTNGLTLDLYKKGNERWRDLFDGAVGAIDHYSNFELSPNTTENDGVFSATVGGEANDNRLFFDMLPGVDGRVELQVLCLVAGSFLMWNGTTYKGSWLDVGPFKIRGKGSLPTYLPTKLATAGMQITNIAIREILPAKGALLLDVTIVPELDQWTDTTKPLKLLMGDSGNAMLQVDNTNGKFELTDGTNSIQYDVPYVAGTKYEVILAWSADGMYLIVNGVQSLTVPFVGTFNLGQYFKVNGHEDMVMYANIRTHIIKE